MESSAFGRFGAGVASDKIGRYNVFTIVCYSSGILIFAVWLPTSGNAAIMVFAALFGFASGGYISLSPALAAQISPYKELGYRLGLMFFFASFADLTTNPNAGTILEHSGSPFKNVKIYSGAFCLGGSTLALLARFLHTGPKLWARF